MHEKALCIIEESLIYNSSFTINNVETPLISRVNGAFYLHLNDGVQVPISEDFYSLIHTLVVGGGLSPLEVYGIYCANKSKQL